MGVQSWGEGSLKPSFQTFLSFSYLERGGYNFQFPNIISLRKYGAFQQILNAVYC